MIDKAQIHRIFGVFAAAVLFSSPAFAQGNAQDNNKGPDSAPSVEQSAYHAQITGLMEEVMNAKTDEQRKAAHARMKQVREQYRAAHPAKELTPAEKEARRQKLEEMLKKDPFQWRMFQLRQTLSNAKTEEERANIQKQMDELRAKRIAEEEAKLTPEQKAARQVRQERNARMRTELKPLMEQLRAAKTSEERKPIHERMQEVFKKYQ